MNPSHPSQAISIVIPVFNEENNIGAVYNELKSVLIAADIYHEIIFVNDGSRDGSAKVLDSLKTIDSQIKVVDLVKNSGQGMATYLGISEATMPLITFMDCDLQNDPAALPDMIRLCKNESVVLGYRKKRKDNFVKTLMSGVGNSLMRQIFQVDIKDAGCSLKVGPASVFKQVPYFKNYHRYLGLIMLVTRTPHHHFETNHRPRHTGNSKHSPLKFLDILNEWWYLKSEVVPQIGLIELSGEWNLLP